MAFDPNQPYGQVSGDGSRAHFIQGGNYYDINGVLLGTSVTPTDPMSNPVLRDHAAEHRAMGNVLTGQFNPVTGVIEETVGDKFMTGRSVVASPNTIVLDDSFIASYGSKIALPNPYAPGQPDTFVHPSILHFPEGWKGHKYWIAYTPYPASNSDYENPCIAVSNDRSTWEPRGRFPLVDKPTGGYNADTHLFMSSDNLTMYLAFRERGVSSKNNLKIMHTTDGVTWSDPVTVLQGTFGTQDFASPSIWWNGTGWTLVSHNLDAGPNWPVERRVSVSANIYDGFGSGTAVTIARPSGRQWWHSFSMKLSSGQVVACFQDNNGSAGNAGNVYWAESGDDGATYVLGEMVQAKSANVYRCSFCAHTVDGVTKIELYIGDFTAGGVFVLDCELGRIARKKRLTLEIAQILSAGASLPGGVVFSDTFDRADSAVSLGTSSSGGTYTISAGTLGISGNKAYVVASGKALVETGKVNHKISMRFPTFTSSIQQWLIARAVDASNNFRCGAITPNATGLPCALTLQSIVAGGIGSVNKVIGYIMAGDTIDMEAIGSILVICINGVEIHRELMTVHSAGTKVGFQGNAGATTTFDNLVVFA